MSAKARSKIGLIRSQSKWGRSKYCHFARQNHRKKTSDQYLRKFKNVVLSQFSADHWIPCPSGYTRSQGWGALSKAWLGYKIANNPKNGEPFQDRLQWAIAIQNIQTDLGLQRTAFPTLGIEGDYVFAYSLSKQIELGDLDNELWLKEYKKKRRAHIQEIVNGSMLTEQEREWIQEYSPPQFTTETILREENGYVERVVMPNLIDIRARDRQPVN
jgi:hypothetical protein